MVIVACGDTTEEAAVETTEEEHDHEGESTLEQVQERGFLSAVLAPVQLDSLK